MLLGVRSNLASWDLGGFWAVSFECDWLYSLATMGGMLVSMDLPLLTPSTAESTESLPMLLYWQIWSCVNLSTDDMLLLQFWITCELLVWNFVLFSESFLFTINLTFRFGFFFMTSLLSRAPDSQSLLKWVFNWSKYESALIKLLECFLFRILRIFFRCSVFGATIGFVLIVDEDFTCRF